MPFINIHSQKSLSHLQSLKQRLQKESPAASSRPSDSVSLKGNSEAESAPFLSPLSNNERFPARDENGFHTVLVSVVGEDAYRFSKESREAFTALTESQPDMVRDLPKSEGGSSLFDSQKVYLVHESQLEKFSEIVEKDSGLAQLDMSKLLNLKPNKNPQTSKIVAGLESDNVLSKTQAMLDLHKLSQEGKQNFDGEALKTVLDETYSLNGGLLNLFNATLLEETRERRGELIEQMEDAKSIGESFGNYFDASGQAKDELRARGSTPQLKQLQSYVLKSAEVLESIGSKRGLAMHSQLLPQADGMILEQIAKSPERSERLVNHMLGELERRTELTAKMFKMRAEGEEIPRGMHGSSASGGFEHMTGRYEVESVNGWHEDCPFEDLPRSALLLLGTEQSEMVRKKLEQALLVEDKRLGSLQELHYKGKERKERARVEEGVSEFADGRAKTGFIKQEMESFQKEYETITSQKDVRQLIGGLVWNSLQNQDVFSQERAQTEAARLITDVLPQLENAHSHRQLADAGLSLLTRGKEMTPEARESLTEAVASVALDPEVPYLAASRLSTQGEFQTLPTTVKALKHENAEVRRRAVNALLVVTAASKGRDVSNAEPLVEAFKNPQNILKIQPSLFEAIPALETMLSDDDTVWLRTCAANVLADVKPDSPQAIEMLSELLQDNGNPTRFYKGRPSEKNVNARTEAAEGLGRFGCHASAAVPLLKTEAEFGRKADAILAQVEEKKEARSAEEGEYFPQNDPEMREAMAAILKEAARPGNVAEKHLDFLNSEDAPNPADLKSWDRDDYPFAISMMHTMSTVGKAASTALEKIQGA